MHVVTVPLQIIDFQEEGFHPLIQVGLLGKTFTLVVDTGASKTAFDLAMFTIISANAVIKENERLSTGLGTNNMASSTTPIYDLFIGNFLVPEFEVAILDLSTINIAYRQLGHPEVLGVLGGDILMKYKAVIDYGSETLTLKFN
jgi:Aspartyl protease